MIVYPKIKFSITPLEYDLDTNSDLLLVRGNSGEGKTYLLQKFKDLRAAKVYKDIICIDYNYTSEDVEAKLKSTKHKLIVIDNADIILTDEIKHYIMFDRYNQYIIFGRNCENLNVALSSFRILKRNNNTITLERELM